MSSGAGAAAGTVVVHAVIVTFHPDQVLLLRVLEQLMTQVSKIHVIDNTPGHGAEKDWAACPDFADVDFHALGGNFGIATALNEGIRRAIENGASHVVLSDQDSLPEDRMVSGLLEAMTLVSVNGVKVAAVGPTFTDRNTGITLPFQVEAPGKLFYGHAMATEHNPVVEALTLITSGSLVPLVAFREIGLMREDLFIDSVDMEWCLRARARGWRVFGTGLARMDHSMGDGDLDVWYFGWRKETRYGPLRLYYRLRNYVALCREGWIDWRWKVRYGRYTLGVVYSQLFGEHRWGVLAMAVRGVWDGLRNRLGRYQSG